MQILLILFIQNDLKISHVEPLDDYHYYKHDFYQRKILLKNPFRFKVFLSLARAKLIKMY